MSQMGTEGLEFRSFEFGICLRFRASNLVFSVIWLIKLLTGPNKMPTKPTRSLSEISDRHEGVLV